MDQTLAARQDQGRYLSDLLVLHDCVSVRGIDKQVSSDSLLYLARRPAGLLVLAARDRDIPERHLLAIQAFRLAQYLRLRFASAELAFSRAMLAEPCQSGRDEIHLLVLDEDSGTILRYFSLLGTADPEPMSMTDPRRSRYPCEVAHQVSLFEHAPEAPATDSSHVWEIKRLVQPSITGQYDGRLRARVTIESVLGLYSVLAQSIPEIEVLVGDGEEGIAIRRLQRIMSQTIVFDGTAPSLPTDELMFPLYTQREDVKPFLAHAPSGLHLQDLIDSVSNDIEATGPISAFKMLMTRVDGQLRRVKL